MLPGHILKPDTNPFDTDEALIVQAQAIAGSSKPRSKPCKSRSSKAPSKDSIIWKCASPGCEKPIDSKKDRNVWVVCDNKESCNRAYHLQCSGIDYDDDDYYYLDIERIEFMCQLCEFDV